jgi:hypothetical protein
MNNDIHRSILTVRDFVSGLCAGVAQILVGQPLDLAKVYTQMADHKISIREICKQIWK